MKLGRRQFLTLAGGAVAAPAVARVAWGQTPQVTLKLHHFLPPVSNGHAKLLVPWAKKVEAEFRQPHQDRHLSRRCSSAARRRSSTIRRATASPTSSGRCPARRPAASRASRCSSCPSSPPSARVPNAKAVQEFYEANLRDEFKEVHPICVWAHDAGLIHANKQIKTMDDLKGLKLRSPTRLAGEALKALGANGIPMPIPQVPEALAQKRARRLRGAVGGRAGHQGARAGQVPHRDPGLADALHRDLRAGDEQAEIRSRCRPT